MPRAALSQSQVDAFRESLCTHATRLFAEQGYEGVTMRALAQSLGCSPMTPYRYFENKEEIFDAVRAAAADRFADALEERIQGLSEHGERLRALTEAYVAFALAEPHAYRIIFELDQGERSPESMASEIRGWNVMYSAVEAAIRAGFLRGEAPILAHLLWSGVHGLVALHLAGKLTLGHELPELVEALIERSLEQAGAGSTSATRLESLRRVDESTSRH